MSQKSVLRRSVLKTSGAALAAMSGISMVGTVAADVKPCEPDCGGGGGGYLNVITGNATVNSNGDVTTYGVVEDYGGTPTVDVWFEFGPQGGSLSNDTNLIRLYGEGNYCDGYESGCNYDSYQYWNLDGTYEYRAIVRNEYGNIDRGGIATFTV